MIDEPVSSNAWETAWFINIFHSLPHLQFYTLCLITNTHIFGRTIISIVFLFHFLTGMLMMSENISTGGSRIVLTHSWNTFA